MTGEEASGRSSRCSFFCGGCMESCRIEHNQHHKDAGDSKRIQLFYERIRAQG